MYKLIPLILLSGCQQFSVKAGVSYFDDSRYDGEKKLNPLGVIRAEYETEDNNEVFCEHVSSIPYNGNGDALDHCGFLFKL